VVTIEVPEDQLWPSVDKDGVAIIELKNKELKKLQAVLDRRDKRIETLKQQAHAADKALARLSDVRAAAVNLVDALDSADLYHKYAYMEDHCGP
jgi:hypothetical protein